MNSKLNTLAIADNRSRLLASACDLLIVGLPYSLIVLALGGKPSDSDWKWMLMIVFMFYQLIFQHGPKAATPGKRLFGLYVVHLSGRTLTIWEHLARAMALCIFIPTFISYITIAINPQRRGWHDQLAETIVLADQKK
jgi:uncharacterized RDD family membrane protein YckC